MVAAFVTSHAYVPPVRQVLSFLHVSAQLVIIDKPSGLLTVPGRGSDKSDCLLSRVQVEFPDAMVVRRLDMSTSGIIVMGRGAYYQRELSVLFQDRNVKKHYQAIVDGQMPLGEEGEITLPIAADWPNRPLQKIDLIAGRASVTRYRVISVDRQTDTSRIELVPITGRTHQLRVHMEYAGHPILGDGLYGSEESRAKAARLMLHASFIEFVNPATGRLLSVVSTPPF